MFWETGIACSTICDELNRFLDKRNLLQYCSFGYGHSFGVLSHYYGREAGLELREDMDTVLEPGMVVSMEPMLWYLRALQAPKVTVNKTFW